MKDITQIKTASILTVLLGIWIAISPLFISVTGAALTNTIIVGAAIGVLGIAQFFLHNNLPSWIAGLAGFWLFISAFAFSVSHSMEVSLIAAGVIAVVLGLWDGVEIDSQYHPTHTHSHAH